MKPFRLSRRAFLGGASTALALPLLEAMLPGRALAQTAADPRRLMAIYVPNGVIMDAWTPAATGTDWVPTPILQPLAGLKQKLLVLTGLENLPGDDADFDIGHQAPTCSFLTSTSPRENPRHNGMSVDQVAAATLKTQTKLPSLELGTPDNGWNAFMRNISWGANSTPMAKEVSPRAVFDRLFAGFDPNASEVETERRRLLQKSVLDHVLQDTTRLQGRLGVEDRRKVDEYLVGVRELERRVNAQASKACTPGLRPGVTEDPFEVMELMLDLAVLAFKCDLTRVATFMFDRCASDLAYPHLGIDESHHVLSHEVDNPTVRAQVQAINVWHTTQLARFLEKLDAVQETQGTLLDNSCILYSSDLSDGDLHNKVNLPVLVAGKGGGSLRTGRHVRFPAGTPRANLYLNLLQSVGINQQSFGDDGKAPLAGLAA